MASILVLQPEVGAALRRAGEGYDDNGEAYIYRQRLRPVTSRTGVFGLWQKFGLEVRHNAAVDLLATPIVDNVRYDSQAMALQLPTPTGEARSIVEGTFWLWGRKCSILLTSVTLPGQFHLDGAYLDVDPDVDYREK